MILDKLDEKTLLILSGLLAFGITYFFIPVIIRMARYKKIFDEVDDRKVHTAQIPRLGGVGFFAGLIISICLFVNPVEIRGLGGIVSGLLILFFVGIKDDILIIDPLTKLFGQILATIIIIIFGDTVITNFHGFFGIDEVPWIIGFVVTLFVFLLTINAFNFIDGIDGLSSSIGIVTLSAFGIWFFLIEKYNYTIIALSLSTALIAFIRFNVFSKDNKVFMGDTGSMIIGFVVSFLAVKFNEISLQVDVNSKFYVLPAPAVAFGIIIIPYFDLIRVVYIRLLKGLKIFNPDRNHLHHLFLRLGLSHKKVVLIMVLFNISFIFFVFYLSSFMTIRRLLLIEFILILVFSFIPESIAKQKEERQKEEKQNQ